MCTSMAVGAVSLKNPYQIATLSFSCEVVKDHPNYRSIIIVGAGDQAEILLEVTLKFGVKTQKILNS